ncbi:Rabenosyn-5 [Hypsizygus marmoreus]|uniref:Rabenosyn-5 n=1 Tax=Hypsizygus marmoreus TaxID=39966 RepID=A0A369JME7_HYPMA|nr:Rabenosyn-5 [Hypsizygus marmoreus]
MPDPVPYQAYRSKRHSHTPSNPHLVPNVSPPPISRPSSIARSPSPRLNYVSLDKEKDSIAAFAFPNGDSSEPGSPAPVVVVGPEHTNANGIPLSLETPHTNGLYDALSDSSRPLRMPELIGDNEPPTPLRMSTGPSSTIASEVESSASSSHSRNVSNPGKRTSTFRRVPLRSVRSPLPSSPLGPNHSTPSHSRNVSVSSVTRNPLPFQDPPSTSSPIPSLAERPLPPISPEPFSKSGDRHSHRSVTTFNEAPPSSILPSPPLAQSSSNDSNSASSSATPASKPPQPIQAPYRPGFQPKGLYRHLTDDFLAIRHQKREGTEDGGRGSAMKRVEQAKLSRRLQKLIDLHFPDTTSKSGTALEGSLIGRRKSRAIDVGGRVDTASNNRRASSFFDLDIRNLSISDAAGLWRGVVGGSQVHEIRAAEQRITPWQDDAEVTKCPLCTTLFHPLTNRKHHCRLCGQIICALPIKRPQRPAPCSLLFVVDPKTRKIEEVGEGVDYGVRRRRADSLNAGKDATPEDKFLKGVRICRLCRPILLRRQYQQEVIHVPLIVQLYEAFIGLEHDIEESLSHFQDLVLSMSQNDHPPKEASATRKRLLDAFAQYDALAKRIRTLPCPNGPGSSQDRVQLAVMTRASLFLQKNMFPLQSLPTAKKAPTKLPAQPATTNATGGHHIDPESKIAFALQPLLEQEALLESFVDEAQAQRKFEDVKTLKTNLVEIRAEIEKIALNVEGGMRND